MDDSTKRKDIINITETILGKTVKEAMYNIVSLYKKNSGTITAYDVNNADILTLSFKEGRGYLLSTSPLMDKVVFKFSISGVGYYIFIELWVQEEKNNDNIQM